MQVRLYRRSFVGVIHICGAVLLSDQFVLTAAHCEVKVGDDVVIGDHSMDEKDVGEVKTTVAGVMTHTGYKDVNHVQYNDIRLIRLADKVTFSNRIQPICLPSAPIPAHTECIVSGWGALQFKGTPSTDRLQAAKVKIVDDDACAGQHGTRFDGDEMMCAYGKGKDGCQGDSGGPLACKVNGSYVLAGLTSWGVRCASAFPGVYADVYQYLEWIERNRGLSMVSA